MAQSSILSADFPAIDLAQTSLFLDFDGTLVDLVDRPDRVTVKPELAKLLERVVLRMGGRFAIVSGRSIAQLLRFLGAFSERVALVGSHGAEVLTPGSALLAPNAPDALRKAEHCFTEAFAGDQGVVIEVKTFGVAIHFRLDPSVESAAHRLATDFASEHALELQRGKMMVEVRSPGHDKGSGITAVMSTSPFLGSTPIFVGDDLTDERGFRRCAEMGGAGVLVGAPRATAAIYRLPNVAAVHEWLGAL
jgi:trehalose 6-phosphate phosphatase